MWGQVLFSNHIRRQNPSAPKARQVRTEDADLACEVGEHVSVPHTSSDRAARRGGVKESTLWTDAGNTYVARWLADQFNVSDQVIEVRLEKDGDWTPPASPQGRRT